MKQKFKKCIKRMLIILISIVIVLALATVAFLNQASFGKLPEGERLERIEKSPQYKNGKFVNRLPTNQVSDEKSKLQSLYDFLFKTIKDMRPENDLPTVKTNLKTIDLNQDVLIWLGHSSLYIQNSGKRILVDPVLVSASPVSFFNKAFKGTNGYQPTDLPNIDYLILTHDHWDHLDYNTMKNLKDRTQKVICPLGVGAHLKRWGFDVSKIIEMDWNDAEQLDENIKITALPARHFSGRGLTSNKSLWASFMLQSPIGNIYLSGDSGYDTHFQDIKKQFGNIDLAVMENGQYNEDWKDIHILPHKLVTAVKELNPKRLMTIHNSKYALARHTWYDPLEKISEASKQNNFNLLTPMIGETVNLNDSTQQFSEWWKSEIK